MKKILTFIFIIVFCLGVNAQEYKPFPTAEITLKQWHEYFAEVSQKHLGTEQKHQEQKLVTYSDPAQGLQFAFTMEGHPAHPCWVTRQVTKKDGAVHLSQIGYFAGDEAEFSKLFDAYEQMNEKIRESFRK